jgi:hypothetical protein
VAVEVHACGLILEASTWNHLQEFSKLMLLVKLPFVSRRLSFDDEKCRESAGKRRQVKMCGPIAHIRCGELEQEDVQQGDFHLRSYSICIVQCRPSSQSALQSFLSYTLSYNAYSMPHRVRESHVLQRALCLS